MKNNIIKRIILLATLVVAPVFYGLAQNETAKATDIHGKGMLIAGICLVVLALLILIFVLIKTKQLQSASLNVKMQKTPVQKSAPPTPAIQKEFENGGEEFAAISAAIYFYNSELHEKENIILTIEKTTRPYSPWSAKYYGMNDYYKSKNRK